MSSSPVRAPITVIVPVRNEARNLPTCLASLNWVEEILVVDSQSSDATPSIAESFGAKVIQFHYNGGWPKKRQWALDTLPIRNDWVLLLDADEAVSAPLAAEIRAAISEDGRQGFHIALQMHFLGRVLAHGGHRLWKLCLFRHGKGRFECRLRRQDGSMGDMEVHEHVVVDGPTRKLRHPIIHRNYNSLDRYLQKHNEYSNWESRLAVFGDDTDAIRPDLWGTQAQRRRFFKRFLLRAPGSPLLLFAYHYVLRLGFLDGQVGFLYSVLRAVQLFNIKAKIFELESGHLPLPEAATTSRVLEPSGGPG